VIVHIEVQSQVHASFSERMFVYYYRLYDRYKKQVVSLAILGDEHAQWRPKEYSSELWGCGIRMWYPIAKLDDYRQQWHKLQKSTNPFAVVVMAYLKAQETKDNLDERWHWKLNLIRGLYERGWSKENIINLFRFIDWVLAVPKEMEQSLVEKIGEIEEEKQVNYLSPYEQLALDRGVRLTSQENIAAIIRARFGQPSQTVTERLQNIENIETLRSLVEKAVLVNSLKEFE